MCNKSCNLIIPLIMFRQFASPYKNNPILQYGGGGTRTCQVLHPSHLTLKCEVNHKPHNHTNHHSSNLRHRMRVTPYFSMGGEARDLTHSPIPATTLKCGVNPNHTNHSSVNFFPSLVPLCAFPSCYLC